MPATEARIECELEENIDRLSSDQEKTGSIMGAYGAPSTPSPEGAGVGHKMASVIK